MLKKELLALAEREVDLIEKLGGPWTPEEYEKIVEANTVIHNKYVDMAIENPEELEPLKRAIYMQWIGMIEPKVNTAIDGLDPEKEKNAIEMLNYNLYNGNVDKEFLSMVQIYYMITDWFTDYSKADNKYLKQFFKEIDQLKRKKLQEYGMLSGHYKEFDYDRRGGMGRYFKEHYVNENAFKAYENVRKKWDKK